MSIFVSPPAPSVPGLTRSLPGQARIFDRGEFAFREMFNGPILSYESNIAYALRFMIDKKVSFVLASALDGRRANDELPRERRSRG